MSKKNGAEKIWANFSPVKSCVQKIFSKKVVSKIIRTNVIRTNVDWTFGLNVFDHLIFVNFEKSKRPNLCSSQKKDGLQVGGWVGGARAYHYWHENDATFWLHLASWDLPDCQPSWESKMEPSVAKCIKYTLCCVIYRLWCLRYTLYCVRYTLRYVGCKICIMLYKI